MSLIRYSTVNTVTATTLLLNSVVAVTMLTVGYLIKDIFTQRLQLTKCVIL